MSNIRNNLSLGDKIIYLNEPYNIEYIEFIKPGKCKPYIRIKIKNLINFKLIYKTFKTLNNIKMANVYIYKYKYIFNKNDNFIFLNTNNNKEIILNKKKVINNIKWLCKNNFYDIIFWNNNPINFITPKILNIKVIYTDKFYKDNNNIFNNNKFAKLENNIKLKVPLFIKSGDILKVNTKLQCYVSRI